MIKEWQKANVREALLELSNEDLQRQLWLSDGANGKLVSSFDEVQCRLFDDSGVGHDLDRGRLVFSPEIDDSLRRFGDSLGDLAPLSRRLSIEAFIAHPEVAAARAIATAILIQFRELG